jgi:hypothetical protein
MSPRPKVKAYVDIIPAELRARYDELKSKYDAIIHAPRILTKDDWAELAQVEDAQAALLKELHRLFYEHDPLISDAFNILHVHTSHKAEISREHGGAQ